MVAEKPDGRIAMPADGEATASPERRRHLAQPGNPWRTDERVTDAVRRGDGRGRRVATCRGRLLDRPGIGSVPRTDRAADGGRGRGRRLVRLAADASGQAGRIAGDPGR